MLLSRQFAAYLWISLCLGSAQSWAEQPPIIIDSGQFETDSTTDTGANVVTIERTAISASGAKDLGELLRGQVGNASSDGQRPVIDMRGFGPTAGSNTLILIDGRRLNNSSDIAPPDLDSIDLANVERVEIIQGSAGTLYGNQAVGGIINIITQAPTKQGLQVQAGAGSFDAYDLRAQATDKFNGGFAYRLGARQWEDNQDRAQSHSDRHNLSLYLEQKYTGGRVFFEQQAQHEALQLPGSLFMDELIANRHRSVTAYTGDFNNTDTSISTLGLRQLLGSSWILAADLSYRDNDGRFQLSGRGWQGTPSTQTRGVTQFNPHITKSLPFPWADLELTLGSDIEATNYKLKSTYGTQEETQNDYAVYSQLTANLGQDWIATLGLRHAEVSNHIYNGTSYNVDDGVTVASTSLAYMLSPGWRLFTRWDQNYRFAAVDERTNVITGQPADLKNQTGDSYELGTAYQYGKLKIQATGYKLSLHNEISFDSSTYYNINLPHTQRQGAMLEFNWTPTRQWIVGSNYTYTDSRITTGPFTDKNLPLVPRNSGRLFIDYAALQDFGLRLTGTWVGERTLNGDFANNFAPLAGYGIASLAGRYHHGPWHLTTRVDNLLDRKYSDTGSVGYDAAFKLRDAYFPAAGRSLWLTLSYGYAD